MIRPGPRNLITDVAGLAVGNAEDGRARSGVTVILPDRRSVAAVDVRGGAPGTRETALLDPTCLVDAVDALVLSGGSAFGLEAAAGVAAWLAEQGRGVAVGSALVPIVPSAILFDLANGGDKAWGDAPPYRGLGRAAAAKTGQDIVLGNTGAGLGAIAGGIKGGLGSASAVDGTFGVTIGALVAVNAYGSPVMPGQPSLWAWAMELDGEMGGQPPPVRPVPPDEPWRAPFGGGSDQVAGNTIVGVVAIDADLDKAALSRIAMMAHDGIARAVRPAHTPFDGDTLFALSTAARPPPEPRATAVSRIGSLAADVVARAIGRAVVHAETLGDVPSYRALHGSALAGADRR